MGGMEFTNALSAKLDWPNHKHHLFRPSEIGEHAEIERDHRYRGVYLLNGYKLAADTLVDRALSQPFEADQLVYPAIFLYRHFFELCLKQIISVYGPLIGDSKPLPGHELKPLWTRYVRISKHLGASENDSAAKHIYRLLSEFENVDPGSLAFRYQAKQDGTPISIDIEAIDLGWLRQVMDAVQNYFEGTDAFFWEAKAAISEQVVR